MSIQLVSMGNRRFRLALQGNYSAEEVEKMRRGLRVVSMDDKWFSRFEHDTLSVHLQPGQDGATLTEAWLNTGNTGDWGRQHPRWEAHFLRYLIDVELLGKPGSFSLPNPADQLLNLGWSAYLFLVNLLPPRNPPG